MSDREFPRFVKTSLVLTHDQWRRLLRIWEDRNQPPLDKVKKASVLREVFETGLRALERALEEKERL